MSSQRSREWQPSLFLMACDDLMCGYGYDFVDPDVPDEFICLICTMVAREAHQSGCCGRIFCLGCLEVLKTRSYSFNCPNCRENLYRNHFADKNTMRRIRQLPIYCPNKDKGCPWTGELQNVDGHISKCPREMVSCYNNCGVEIERCGLEHHLKNVCSRRFVECVYCGIMAEYQVIVGKHARACSAVLIMCPNDGCSQKLKQTYVADHLRVCPKELVPCKYLDICSKKMKREDEQQHYREEMERHLEKTFTKLQDVKQSYDSLSTKIMEMNRRLDMMTLTHCESNLKVMDSVSSLSAKFQQYQIRCEDPIKFRVKDFDVGGDMVTFDFYFREGGHKFRFSVHPNGIGHAAGTHMSLTLEVIDGEYDDILDGRFTDSVTVELLNQRSDDDHCEGTFQFTHKKFGIRKHTTIYRFCDHDDLVDCYGFSDYVGSGSLYLKLECNIDDVDKDWLV